MKDQIVPLTKELLAIPSVMEDIPHLVKALEWVKTQLPEYTFTPYVNEGFPSLLFTNQPDETKNFKIIFNLHLDVIPAAAKDFQPYEKDGKLYGRGVFDMKAAGVVMLLLFKELGYKLSYPLGLQVTTSEENNGVYGTGYQVSQGVNAEFAITGECNSNFQVTNQSKGRYIIKIGTNGVAAHSAYAWRGRNALILMHEALAPILQKYPSPQDETMDTTVSLTKLESHNDAINKIPDRATAYLDIRFTQKDSGSIIEDIRSLLPNDIIFETIPLHPAHAVDPQNPYILQLQNLVKDVRGEDLPLRFAHATSDATFLKQAVEFGPVGGNAHGDNEWVDIQSLEDYYDILKQFLINLDKHS